ncbi:endonuclease/exonuclease/phosphatase family protein [Streptomyces sp. NPDC056362]|uniref:endonuclease/exonuclease/phosphatase family protein n=1 Tax=unclassified Streptomyces TaxID=2593676 RepID=UPI0035DDB2BB
MLYQKPPPVAFLTLWRILSLFLVTGLMAGFFVGLAQPAHAVVPGQQRVMTWNMAHTPRAWQNAYNYALRYDIVALQEMPMAAISAANVVHEEEILVPGTSYRIERKRLTSRLGYRSDIYLTYVEDSLRPQMYRLGFMTHRRPVRVEIAETQVVNTRPGLVIVDGTDADAITFGSIHAISPGGANASEFVNAVAGRAETLSQGRWAVLGDYNREPGTMDHLPANSLTHSTAPGVRTFRGGGRYDYMVASQLFSDWNIVGRAETSHDSDHYPVFFGDLQAGADPGAPYWLMGGTSESPASWTIGVDQARLEDESLGEDAPFVLQNIRARNGSQVLSPFGAVDRGGKMYSLLLLERSLKCLTIAPGGSGKIVHRNCQTRENESQLWRFDSASGQLVNPQGFTIVPENQQVGSGLRAVSQGATSTWKWERRLFKGCRASSAGNVTVASALNVSVLSDGQTPFPGPEPDPCTAVPTVVSMGDSYISGEAGRWAGNADASAGGSVWGTDRSAVGCNAGESSCTHDLTRVYGDTSYAAKPDAACDRSDSAEINGVAVPGAATVERVNLACSGATTASVLTSTF